MPDGHRRAAGRRSRARSPPASRNSSPTAARPAFADAALLAAQAQADRGKGRPDRASRRAARVRAHVDADPSIERQVERVEEAIDELEQAAFVASLLGDEVDPGDRCAAGRVVRRRRRRRRGGRCRRRRRRDVPEGNGARFRRRARGHRPPVELEHICDARRARRHRRWCCGRLRAAHRSLSALELARALERATDRLAGVGHLLRTHVLAIWRREELMSGSSVWRRVPRRPHRRSASAPRPQPRPHRAARPAGAARLRAAGRPVRRRDGGRRRCRARRSRRAARGHRLSRTATGARFGDRRRPLLVSVRSGAARSMPGMLDTVLDVGCTTAATRGLVRVTGNPRFAWDCRRRFVESHATTVLGLDGAALPRALDAAVRAEGVASERELDGEALERLAAAYQRRSRPRRRDDPRRCDGAARGGGARRLSLLDERARADLSPSRRARPPARHGGDGAGHGVRQSQPALGIGRRLFARSFDRCGDPADRVLVLRPGRGRGVGPAHARRRAGARLRVAGGRGQAARVLVRLEREFGDVQDVEFTIEDGRLWLLQTRSAKRTPRAALRFAVDLVREGVIAPDEARRRLDGLDPAALTLDPAGGPGRTGGARDRRRGWCGGRARGIRFRRGRASLRQRRHRDPGPFRHQHRRRRRLRAVGRHRHGGRRPHRPRGPGGAADGQALRGRLRRARSSRRPQCAAARRDIKEGDWLSIDGEAGAIYFGRCTIVVEQPEAELAEIAAWNERKQRSVSLTP